MAIPFERIVQEDFNRGVGAVAVTMPAGGSATGHQVGLQTWLPDTFSAIDCGAGGLGQSDDTVAVQLAITLAAAVNGVAYVPAGTYLVTGLTGASGVTIRGAGRGQTIIRRLPHTTGSAGAVLSFVSMSAFAVKDLTLDGNNANNSGAYPDLLMASCANWTVDGVEAINAKSQSGIVVLNDANLADSEQSRIANCRCVSNDVSGIFVDIAAFLTIDANLVKGNGAVGIQVINFVFPPVGNVMDYLTITNNRVLGNTGPGIYVAGGYTGGTALAPVYGPTTPASALVVIRNNFCEGNTTYGLAFEGGFGAVTGNISNLNGTLGQAGGGYLFFAEYSTLIGNVAQMNIDRGYETGGARYCTITGNISSSDYALGFNAGTCIGTILDANIVVMPPTGVCGGILAYGFDGTVTSNAFPFRGTQLQVLNNYVVGNGVTGSYGIQITRQMDRVIVRGNACTGFTSPGLAYLLACANVMQSDNEDDVAFAGSNGPIQNIASATSLVIPDVGERFVITGTTTITSIYSTSQKAYLQGVRTLTITTPGSGYSPASPPTVGFSGGGGSSAAGTVWVDNAGAVIGVDITTPGTGYTSAPTVTFSAGAAAATAIVGCNNIEGREVTLIFTGACTVDNGNNLSLDAAANFVNNGGASGTLRLVGVGGVWLELSRTIA